MDSAVSFLFGAEVHSLSAGLPYPPASLSSLKISGVNGSHPTQVFAEAFKQAQWKSARRGRFGEAWPLTEFWKDKVQDHMAVIDSFVKPFVDDALRKKGEKMNDTSDEFDDSDEETLLGHLVKLTDGGACSLLH